MPPTVLCTCLGWASRAWREAEEHDDGFPASLAAGPGATHCECHLGHRLVSWGVLGPLFVGQMLHCTK